MSGLFGGGNNPTVTPVTGLNIQTSANGLPIPLVYGTTVVTPNLLWYGDFNAVAQSQSSGGKGGSQTTGYLYNASFILALCEGPVSGVLTAYINKAVASPSAYFSIFTGTYPQTPWGYLSSNHAAQAIGYQGIAYAAAAAYSLGSSASLPQHSFEVAGLKILSGSSDADPKDVLNDLFTNQVYGLPNAPSISGLSQYSAYCRASGLLISPCYDAQTAASQIVTELMQITNTGAYYSEGVLKLAPYGDAAVTGNGVTYTPTLTVIANFGDDDFLDDGSTEPVAVSRNSIANTVNTTADGFNQVTLEYLDRTNSYAATTVIVQDQASIDVFGLRPMPVITAHQFATGAAANIAAMLILQRSVYVRSQYTFRLGWKWCYLEPTDLVTITDANLGLNLYPVRILSIEEDEFGTLTVLAEDAPPGVSSHVVAPVPTNGGYAVNQLLAPGSTNTPVIFEAPNSLSAPNLELWVAASGGSNWGGCNVWASSDGTTYELIGSITTPARHGLLTSTLPSGTDPDTSHTFGVDMTACRGQLIAGTSVDADSGNTMLWVDGELINYSAATLTSAYHYNLGAYLRRGQMGTANATHTVGAQFARLDSAIFQYTVPRSRIGSPIYLKFPAFNIWGQATEALSSVTPYTHTFAGNAPSPITGLTATGGMFQVTLNWTFTAGQIDRSFVEIWGNTTDSLSTAFILSSVKNPATSWVHPGLTPAQIWYYWARVVDTSGNDSAFYPVGVTAGVPGSPSADPSALLTQLNNSLGISQLSAALAAPITTLTSAPVLAAIGNMPFESAANLHNATNAANAALQSALSDFDLTSRMQWQESVTNATCTIDPITGKIALLATANVTTDVSAQLTAVQVLANATAATLTSTVSTLTTVSGNLTSTQAAVTILQGQITTTASTVYVDNSVANATGPITTTAANAYTALAASELQSAIDAFTGQQSAQALTASVALANTNIATAANAISAQASSFAALVSTVAGGLAAITTEQTTRATADTALAQTTTTLTATVASNLAATNTALATKATIAYVDAATATLTASIASTSSTLTTAYQAADTAALAAAATASTSYVQTYAYSKSAVDTAIASSQTTLTTNFTTGDTTTLTSANAHSDTAAATAYTNAQSYVQGYSYSKSTVDTAIATAQTTLTTNFTAGDATTLTSAQTYVQSYTYSKSTIDTSIATSQSTLTATFNTSNAGNTAASTSLAASDLQNSIDAFVTGQATQLLTANVASAVSFATATATAVSALTTSFSALVASVSGNIALITTEQTARANADGALAQAITTLTASGPTGYAAVSTAALASVSAITGLQAQYVLKVDTNGHSAGMTLASGGTGSAVVFLADKFAFVAPDGSGTPKNVMTVGTIGGVSSFGFNGNAIVDGTIVAQALAVTNLSAITANLGTVTAGRAQNAANTNFIDFNATGTNPFLQVGSNIALNADGSGVFARSLVSAPLLVASGTCGDTTLATAGLSISSGTFYIHTGFNVGSGAWNNVANIYRAGIGANTIYASGGTWHNNHDVWILDARILITPGYVADGRAAPTWNPGNFVSANGSSWASGGLTVTEGDLIIEVTIAGVAQNDAGWSGPVMAALNWSVYRA